MYTDRFNNIIAIVPPLSEQEAIACYLDEKCAKIDAAIENISKQIDVSKRLKRALINEVITGQRAV
jgi:type I restriction enzyme S subunit